MKPVIIDTDGGADDLLALMVALKSEEIEVAAVIVGYGAFPVSEVVFRVSKVMQIVGKQVPILKGAAKPLKQKFEHSYIVHGRSFSRGSWVSESEVLDIDDLEKVLDPKKLYEYVSLGALTNLAGILKTAIGKQINRIVMMGGALNFPGNVTPFSEANLYQDPEADIEVFLSEIPIYLFPLNITEKILFMKDDIQQLPWSEFIGDFWQDYEDFYVKTKKGYTDPVTLQFSPYHGTPMHDVLPIVFLLNHDIFRIEKVIICLDFVKTMRGMVVPLLRDYPRYNDQLIGEIFCACRVEKDALFKTVQNTLNNDGT